MMSWIPLPLFNIPLARNGGSAPNRLWRQRPELNENSLTFTLMSNPGIADGSLCLTKWHGSRQAVSVLNTDKHLRPRSPIESVRCPPCCGEQIVGQGAGEHELGRVVSNFPRSPRLFRTTVQHGSGDSDATQTPLFATPFAQYRTPVLKFTVGEAVCGLFGNQRPTE